MVPPQVLCSARRRFVRALAYSDRRKIASGQHELNEAIDRLKNRLRLEKLSDYQRCQIESEILEHEKTVRMIRNGYTGY